MLFSTLPSIASFASIVGPQGLKVISSSAMSFPQPPGALFFILTITDETFAGVSKKVPNCFQAGASVSGIAPVL